MDRNFVGILFEHSVPVVCGEGDPSLSSGVRGQMWGSQSSGADLQSPCCLLPASFW